MIVFLLLSTVASLCLARPNIHDVDPQNMVTVPPNCSAGQEWINGQCRDVWRAGSICPIGHQFVNGQCRETFKAVDYQTDAVFLRDDLIKTHNDVLRTEADVNGMPPNMVTVPPNCPDGQELINGACREIWRAGFQSSDATDVESRLMKTILKSIITPQEIKQIYENDEIGSLKNVISIPNQCPAGYKPDALGICREIFS